jgi:hypothetical protein
MKVAMLLLFMSISIAQVAEPTGTLTLACKGTVQHGIPGPGNDYPKQDNPEPVAMSLVLNLMTRKLEITGFDLLFPIEIAHMTETLVFINSGNSSRGIIATINRLTGEMEAKDIVQENGLYSTTSYELKCKPTQRMF